MKLADIKEDIILPERALLLNKTFTTRGTTGLLACITQQDGIVRLWVIYHHELPDWVFDADEPPEYATNRDMHNQGLSQYSFSMPWMARLTIQGQTLEFISGSSTPFLPDHHMQYMHMQYFWDAGVDTSAFDQYRLRDISITEQELEKGTAFPEIDPQKPLDITIEINDASMQYATNGLHTVEQGVPHKERYTFTDHMGKEHGYYINGLSLYDMRAEWEKTFTDEKLDEMQALSGLPREELLEQRRVSLEEILPKLCPKGSVFAVVEYETEGDEPLSFYTSEYLNSPHIPNDEGGALGIIGSPEDAETTGPHGYRQQYCHLQHVPPNFTGSFEIELFSWHMRLPGETIKIERKA